ncbi:MAG: HD domain-containing protein [Candidatus Gracilibacteria bacterium]
MKRNEVEKWLDEFHTPAHIREHSEKVAQLGEDLAKKLKKVGEQVDPEKVWIAGMIHDMVRVVDFKKDPDTLGTPEDREIWKALREQYKGWHHADAAADILRKRGEEELADIVARHKYTCILSDTPPRTWEEKILYYADKRVAHDQIVSLQERFDEGHKRHHPGESVSPEEKQRREAILALEKEIFKFIVPSPAGGS